MPGASWFASATVRRPRHRRRPRTHRGRESTRAPAARRDRLRGRCLGHARVAGCHGFARSGTCPVDGPSSHRSRPVRRAGRRRLRPAVRPKREPGGRPGRAPVRRPAGTAGQPRAAAVRRLPVLPHAHPGRRRRRPDRLDVVEAPGGPDGLGRVRDGDRRRPLRRRLASHGRCHAPRAPAAPVDAGRRAGPRLPHLPAVHVHERGGLEPRHGRPLPRAGVHGPHPRPPAGPGRAGRRRRISGRPVTGHPPQLRPSRRPAGGLGLVGPLSPHPPAAGRRPARRGGGRRRRQRAGPVVAGRRPPSSRVRQPRLPVPQHGLLPEHPPARPVRRREGRVVPVQVPHRPRKPGPPRRVRGGRPVAGPAPPVRRLGPTRGPARTGASSAWPSAWSPPCGSGRWGRRR